jgi:formate/nitrite transporter FocA (FNT family)
MAHLADELSVWRRSARQAWAQGFWTARMRAICAGLLIALMVWLLPGTESAGASITIILTYRVGISGLNHIIRDPPPFFSGGH